MDQKALLSIQNLVVSFGTKKKRSEIIHSISFDVYENEIVGIVGESGSGKSVTSLSIMGLLPKKTAFLNGSISFEDQDLLKLDEKSYRKLRGKDIAMIFQEPMSALNPSLKCGYQVSEILRLHLKMNYSEAKKETISLFKKVKLPRPDEIFNSYPHQISGGQMQRVMIAMAIACKPKLLIADEPTTALDVTVQKEILTLLKSLQQEIKMAMLFISHDLNLVSEIADRVVVMYKADVVDDATASEIFHNPQAEYTKALLAARPSLEVRLAKLPTISSIADKSFVPKEIKSGMRARRHKQIYTQEPILEIQNLEKYYFSNADRKSTRLNSSHVRISYAVFCLKKKNKNIAGAVDNFLQRDGQSEEFTGTCRYGDQRDALSERYQLDQKDTIILDHDDGIPYYDA